MIGAEWRSCGRSVARLLPALALAAALLAAHPTLAQQAGERALDWHLDDGAGWAPSESASACGRRRAPAGQAAPQPAPFLHLNNQTLRQIVRVSLGGRRARVVVSNAFGTVPLTIGGAHLALRDSESGDRPASARALTFSGQPTMAIPAGRGAAQRSRGRRGAAAGRSRGRPLSAGQHEHRRRR